MRQGWGDPVIHASTRSTRAPRRKIPTNHSMNPCLLPPFPHAAGCPGRTLSSPLILSQPHIQSTAKFCQPFPRRHSSQTRALLPFSAPASLLHSLVRSLCRCWDKVHILRETLSPTRTEGLCLCSQPHPQTPALNGHRASAQTVSVRDKGQKPRCCVSQGGGTVRGRFQKSQSRIVTAAEHKT